MERELKKIANDLVSKTFPHMFPSLENILTVVASEEEVKIQNPVKEVIFKIISQNHSPEALKLILEATNPDSGENLSLEVEVRLDKSISYLSDPPIKDLVGIFDRSC